MPCKRAIVLVNAKVCGTVGGYCYNFATRNDHIYGNLLGIIFQRIKKILNRVMLLNFTQQKYYIRLENNGNPIELFNPFGSFFWYFR